MNTGFRLNKGPEAEFPAAELPYKTRCSKGEIKQETDFLSYIWKWEIGMHG
jgi:hypothetical protein